MSLPEQTEAQEGKQRTEKVDIAEQEWVQPRGRHARRWVAGLRGLVRQAQPAYHVG
jgi:hypothetical protein